MARSGSQIIESKAYEEDEHLPAPIESCFTRQEDFQKREEW
jgi:hypothetical protein